MLSATNLSSSGGCCGALSASTFTVSALVTVTSGKPITPLAVSAMTANLTTLAVISGVQGEVSISAPGEFTLRPGGASGTCRCFVRMTFPKVYVYPDGRAVPMPQVSSQCQPFAAAMNAALAPGESDNDDLITAINNVVTGYTTVTAVQFDPFICTNAAAAA